MCVVTQHASRQPLCTWAPGRRGLPSEMKYMSHQEMEKRRKVDWGNNTYFEGLLQSHQKDFPTFPCFTTYEGSWNAADAFGMASPPIVVTMVREPAAWAMSALHHHAKITKGLDRQHQLGCLNLPRNSSCNGYDIPEGQHSQIVPNWKSSRSLEVAKRRLDSAVFGVTEHFAATECLIMFQFGHLPLPPKCECAKITTESIGKTKYSKISTSKEFVSPKSLSALFKLQNEDTPASAFYAYALTLFLSRIKYMENVTGMKVICNL